MVSTTIAFFAVELMLAWLYPVSYMQPPEPVPADTWRELLHRSSAIPGLSYELVPDREKESKGVRIKTNSHGMRDDEPLEGSGDSACNILVLGDSYTFGFGVEGNETYSNVLEGLLKNDVSGKVVQVLNSGVGGYSSKDEALVLKSKGLKWNPKLIIVGYVLNDPEIEPVQPLHRYYQDERWWQYFNALRLVAKAKYDYDVKTLGGGNYLRYLHSRDGDKWKSVEAAFLDIQEVARKKDVPVLLVIFPMMKGVKWADYPYGDLQSQVASAGRESGFPTIDLTDVYSVHSQKVLMVAPDDAHPNALGHKLAAEAIYQMIQEHNLLACI